VNIDNDQKGYEDEDYRESRRPGVIGQGVIDDVFLLEQDYSSIAKEWLLFLIVAACVAITASGAVYVGKNCVSAAKAACCRCRNSCSKSGGRVSNMTNSNNNNMIKYAIVDQISSNADDDAININANEDSSGNGSAAHQSLVYP
jgi:hypothetical protein